MMADRIQKLHIWEKGQFLLIAFIFIKVLALGSRILGSKELIDMLSPLLLFQVALTSTLTTVDFNI